MEMHQDGSQARFLFHFVASPFEAVVVRFEGREDISQLFCITVTLAAEAEMKPLADIVGREAVLTVLEDSPDFDARTPGHRYFHGIISKMEQSGRDGRYHLYKIILVPALWRLSLRKNCRIFQETTTQQIVRMLLEENGINSLCYRFALTNEDRPRGFCVQYRETDLDFILRLLQEEGIFYFFEQFPDKHLIVFGDHHAVHPFIKGNRQIRFNEHGGLEPTEESIESFSHSHTLTSDRFVYRNFSFKRPSLDLTVERSAENRNGSEVYDYPAPYTTFERGSYLAKVRLEERTAMQVQAHGQTTSCRIIPGYTFTLANHPLPDANTDYLIVSAAHFGEQSQSLQELTQDRFRYDVRFTVIPSSTPFRPQTTIQKPVVQGLQTAMVVGPEKEEIHTDRYGRVKVRFHWDREAKRNDRSSCWLRCAQGWGGGGWGMLFTPRVGDEVLVDFLEGDPDRPLIVGSVYNEANLPLYDLPAGKTISTIKSKSYPNGSGYNELRFEDKNGSEEIYLHGQRDWTVGIENDKDEYVGHNDTLKVRNNRDKTVGADQRVAVGSNHSETIGANKSIRIGRDKTETVGLNSSENVGLAKELTTGGLYQVTVGGAMNETVAGAKAEEVGMSKSVLVGTGMSEKVTGSRSIFVGGNFSTTVNQTSTLQAKTIVLEADDEILLRCGASTICMKSDGEIRISGKRIETKGSGDVVIKGARISEN